MGLPAPSKSQFPQVASGSWPTTPPDAAPATCKSQSLEGADGASVVSYLDDNSKQQNLLAKEARGISLIDFVWASVASPAHVVQTDSFDPALTTELTTSDQASPCGLRFLTVTDNDPSMSHTADVRMMAKVLTNSTARQQQVREVAQVMASQPLATGLTVDYEFGLPKNLSDLALDEQVAGWHGLSLDQAVNRLTGDYTELIRELAIAMHQQHRLLRVDAPVRSSDDVDVATTDIAPYLLDYGTLAKYADQLVLEAYDFHFATGDPGPIAPFADVAKVLTYVHSYNVPWSKLAVSIPSYAYDWTVNSQGNIAVSASGQPISATTLTATQVASSSKRWRKVTTENGETEYGYTQAGRKHIVWDAASALGAETAWLQRNYPHIGVNAWRIGNADPTGSALAVQTLK
jgi:spore germination protein YaaH